MITTMTNLEITRLCAKAMGYTILGTKHGDHIVIAGGGCLYDPLHDDAQAMALIKKLQINIIWFEVNIPSPFQPTVYMWSHHPHKLNRLVCESAATMQAAKAPA